MATKKPTRNPITSTQNPERREFLRRSVFVSALVLGAQALSQGLARKAFGQGEPADLDPKDPTAKDQGYVANIDKLAKKPPEHKPNSYCWNCVLYTSNFVPAGATADKSQKGSCARFAMKRVEAKGWCKAWVENGAMKGKKHS